MQKLKRALVPAALVALAGACGDPDAPQLPYIEVRDNSFLPRMYNAKRGDTVWWVWSGNAAHDVVFGDGGPSSTIKSFGDFKRVFSGAGTYGYLCTLHGGMVGTIIVAP